MPTSTDLSNAHPGDVVVPLSDMLDLLASRLEEDELDDISEELIRRRTSQVTAGDVISAEMMNQILADVANLQTRVMVLEAGIPDVDRPQIFLVAPSDGVRISEQLQVSGFNLAPEQLTSVRMGNRAVQVFSSASHDKLLAFDVPPILGIPEEGADVNLEITNDFGSDSIMVNVLRIEVSELTVAITLAYQSIPSEELEPGTDYPITVRISAISTLESEYIITPSIDNSGWSVALDETSNRILIPQSQMSPFVIDVDATVTTGFSGSANFSMRIEAVGHPDQFGQSETLPLAIGDEPEVNTDITFQTPLIPPQNLDSGTGNILLAPGGAITIGVNAVLATIGDYDISAPEILNDGDGNWSTSLTSASTTFADVEDELHLNRLQLQLTSGAPVTSPLAQLRFTMSRQGSTEPPAEFLINLQVSATP
jgi:hypothetical protein